MMAPPPLNPLDSAAQAHDELVTSAASGTVRLGHPCPSTFEKRVLAPGPVVAGHPGPQLGFTPPPRRPLGLSESEPTLEPGRSLSPFASASTPFIGGPEAASGPVRGSRPSPRRSGHPSDLWTHPSRSSGPFHPRGASGPEWPLGPETRCSRSSNPASENCPLPQRPLGLSESEPEPTRKELGRLVATGHN